VPKPLRAVAGEALTMLAMESPDNCSAMLMDEPGYELIADLAKKLQHGDHIYTVASLLQNLCENCREVLRNQGPSDHLSSTLIVVSSLNFLLVVVLSSFTIHHIYFLLVSDFYFLQVPPFQIILWLSFSYK
jgi:hypothetical protein